MTTKKQIQANQKNAQKSTGPTSVAGKLKVSGNRISHGILSRKLLLENESAEEYQILQDSLQQQLNPVGILELTLVERIAISLWRQRRLVCAETATIALAMTPRSIAETVGEGMGISRHSTQALKPKDLEPPDQEQVEWCQAVIAECEGATTQNLKESCPLLFAQLSEDAEQEDMTPTQYLEQVSDGAEYILEMMSWCRGELEKADRYGQIIQLTGPAVDKLSIPWGKLDTFNKYQASLDNQLHKTMRAFKDAQEWRLKTIEAEPNLETESTSEAA